jgi:hypothetical protein
MCRPPVAWDHLEVCSASVMGPPVRQRWDGETRGEQDAVGAARPVRGTDRRNPPEERRTGRSGPIPPCERSGHVVPHQIREAPLVVKRLAILEHERHVDACNDDARYAPNRNHRQ